MNYLLKAAEALGIYYTPEYILGAGYGDGKTAAPEYIAGNLPFAGTGDNTMTILGTPEYRALARRYAALLAQKAPDDYTSDDLAGIYAVSDAMSAIELAHKSRCIEAITDDYAFAIGQAGNLGGVEIL